MKHKPGLEGKTVRLTENAVWRNYGDTEARGMLRGAYLRLESYRPEGYNAVTAKGKHFFLLAKYLETAVEIVELTPDAEREIVGELLNVWNFCGDEAEFWREKRWQYKIADGQQLAIVTTAEKQWKAYQKQHN